LKVQEGDRWRKGQCDEEAYDLGHGKGRAGGGEESGGEGRKRDDFSYGKEGVA
jgi:hypothetical protein